MSTADHHETGDAEVTSGIRSIFSAAPVYRWSQRLVGAERFRETIVGSVLRPTPDERILDVGCGTADILEHLPAGVDYVGIDHSDNYIADARARFGDRGRFEVGDVSAAETTDRTLVVSIGVLHHLDDEAVRGLFSSAADAAIPGARIVTVDPTLVDGQARIARLMITNDRGQHVRTPEQLRALIEPLVDAVDINVRHDLLRTPYTHAIVDATLTCA